MGCNCGGNKIQQAVAAVSNLGKAAVAQTNVLQWFRDGVSNLVKCLNESQNYTDEDIRLNRQVCKTCEYATLVDGELATTSQCMAPDPEKNGAPCGCFLVCKTQVGRCPLNKWTTTFQKVTINESKA